MFVYIKKYSVWKYLVYFIHMNICTVTVLWRCEQDMKDVTASISVLIVRRLSKRFVWTTCVCQWRAYLGRVIDEVDQTSNLSSGIIRRPDSYSGRPYFLWYLLVVITAWCRAGCVIACLAYFVTECIISVSVILLRDAGLYFVLRSNLII